MRFSLLVVLLTFIMTFSLYKCDDYQSEPELSTEELSDDSSEETEIPDQSLSEISEESKTNEIKANVSPTESNAVKEVSGSDAEQKSIESNVKQNARQFDDEEEKVESLCDNPVIHSADRLVNNTFRVYRNHHYWELIGLPSREASVDGPFKIWWNNFGPITKNICTHTVLAGIWKGTHLKYVRNRFGHWNHLGIQTMGSKTGLPWDSFPEHGFTACYHDGQASGLGSPLLVSFHALKVYYYDTNSWFPFRSRNGYIGGQFGEKFPPDLTAAFSFPSYDPKVKYYVYLFQKDKYCFRPWITNSSKPCDDWRDNKELFGCYKNGPKPGTEPTQQPGPGPVDPGNRGVKEPTAEPGKQTSGTLLLLKPQIIIAFICLIFSFHLQYLFKNI